MAKRATSATVYVCDGCGREYIKEDMEEPPYGYYLTAVHISGAGGDGQDDIFACKQDCIKMAVLRGLRRDDRDGSI